MGGNLPCHLILSAISLPSICPPNDTSNSGPEGGGSPVLPACLAHALLTAMPSPWDDAPQLLFRTAGWAGVAGAAGLTVNLGAATRGTGPGLERFRRKQPHSVVFDETSSHGLGGVARIETHCVGSRNRRHPTQSSPTLPPVGTCTVGRAGAWSAMGWSAMGWNGRVGALLNRRLNRHCCDWAACPVFSMLWSGVDDPAGW
ncbi:hypothetical protein EV126DRAFT_431386 [Verticillium dahliae]|nr:hypothetical protein EV126DRAFT_434988 [Verticillium dahliae]KAH6689296.1 hypothetical protein EV126DRAFT_431386 [Verticillium dahliae]